MGINQNLEEGMTISRKESNRANIVVIVECYSSAVNYIHDIRERGFKPVLLEFYLPYEKRESERALNDKAYAFNNDPYPEVIMAKEHYDETLDMIQKLDPILILPGSDRGMELALRLSSDLCLKSNPLSILWQLRDKYAMQKALELAGMRYIRSHIVRSEEEAIDFYIKGDRNKVVLKPTQGSASYNVFICQSESEIRNAYLEIERYVRRRSRKKEAVIIQEYIDGEEYAVDTVSCKGKHAALFGMKYLKRVCKGYGKIYDTDNYFSPDDPAVTEIIDYCFQALSCLGVQYGCVHSEIMVDEKGPVLIEVNARPAGVFQKYTFQDKVMKNHETAVSLDSYFMDQNQFFDCYSERMHLKQPAVVKQICLDEAIFVKRVKITERLSRLDSFDYAIENGENCIYPKTTDLDTNGGMIYLTSPDPETIEKDLAEILLLEKEGLQELYDFEPVGSEQTTQ